MEGYQRHGKFMEVDGRYPGGTESWQKFTEGLPTVRKIDRILWEIPRWHGKLT